MDLHIAGRKALVTGADSGIGFATARQLLAEGVNAKQMGATAGRIMAGSEEVYNYTPYYYSNVFDMSYQAVGTHDSSLVTVEDWVQPLQKGVIYYLDGDTADDALLWNVKDKLDAARNVLADKRPQDASTLKGRTPF